MKCSNENFLWHKMNVISVYFCVINPEPWYHNLLLYSFDWILYTFKLGLPLYHCLFYLLLFLFFMLFPGSYIGVMSSSLIASSVTLSTFLFISVFTYDGIWVIITFLTLNNLVCMLKLFWTFVSRSDNFKKC